MTLCVGQLPLLSCCRTSNILRAFYEAVKCFCAAPMPKKNPPFGGFLLLRFLYFYFRHCDFEPRHASVQDLET